MLTEAVRAGQRATRVSDGVGLCRPMPDSSAPSRSHDLGPRRPVVARRAAHGVARHVHCDLARRERVLQEATSTADRSRLPRRSGRDHRPPVAVKPAVLLPFCGAVPSLRRVGYRSCRDPGISSAPSPDRRGDGLTGGRVRVPFCWDPRHPSVLPCLGRGAMVGLTPLPRCADPWVWGSRRSSGDGPSWNG
jgi:hypothetical protein